MNNFFAYEAVDIDGVNVKMSEFSNKKAILVVNVACKWALTNASYQELVNMYKIYKELGLEILAFPSN